MPPGFVQKKRSGVDVQMPWESSFTRAKDNRVVVVVDAKKTPKNKSQTTNQTIRARP
jgi:hypothetical protein